MPSQQKNHLQQGCQVPPLLSAAAGSFSGAVSRMVTAPLDIVKIRLQLQVDSSKYTGIVGTMRTIVKEEGIKALWKGNVPAEVMYILYGATQFTCYSTFNTYLFNAEEHFGVKVHASIHSLIVGACSGTTSTIFTYPFDFLRTRFAANSSKVLLPFGTTVTSIYKREGVKGFYAGVKPAICSITASTGIMFWTYSVAREFSSKINIPFVEPMCGFVAGAVSKGFIFPLDLIRKRLQMYGTIRNPSHQNSVWGVAMQVSKKEGIRGFYKGFYVALLKTAPTSAISIWMYELSIRLITKKEVMLKVNQ